MLRKTKRRSVGKRKYEVLDEDDGYDADTEIDTGTTDTPPQDKTIDAFLRLLLTSQKAFTGYTLDDYSSMVKAVLIVHEHGIDPRSNVDEFGRSLLYRYCTETPCDFHTLRALFQNGFSANPLYGEHYNLLLIVPFPNFELIKVLLENKANPVDVRYMSITGDTKLYPVNFLVNCLIQAAELNKLLKVKERGKIDTTIHLQITQLNTLINLALNICIEQNPLGFSLEETFEYLDNLLPITHPHLQDSIQEEKDKMARAVNILKLKLQPVPCIFSTLPAVSTSGNRQSAFVDTSLVRRPYNNTAGR